MQDQKCVRPDGHVWYFDLFFKGRTSYDGEGCDDFHDSGFQSGLVCEMYLSE